MAVTRLSDLPIIPELFANGINLESLNKDLLIQSGAVYNDAALNAFLNSPLGGTTTTIRQLSPLDDSDANISSDDPAAKSTPDKLGAITTTAVRQSLNKSWSEMDLVVDLYGLDPLSDVQSRITKYWMTHRQKRLLATIQGLIADSVANHGGDMVIDKAAAYVANLTPDDMVSAELIIDAAALMGDRASELKGLAVHSVVFATMQKLNLITTERLSDTDIHFSTYMGFPVIVDDTLTVETIPAVVGGGSAHPAYNRYYSYVFGYGAFAAGVGSPKVPFEIKRDPDSGNGGGQETVYSRQELILHPQGYKCNLTATPTLAQLAAAATWTRAYERKRVPLSVFVTRA